MTRAAERYSRIRDLFGAAADVPPDERSALLDARCTDDDALKVLVTFDERKSRIVELRFLAASRCRKPDEVIEVSARTVRRECRLAKAWLQREPVTEKKHATAE